MKIINFLQMNDWKIGKFIRMIIAIQLMLWGLIGLDQIGFQIPVLRQVVGFIYLTFIPGVIILRILKMHELGNVRTLLYSVGLSIGTVMFSGFLVNISGIPHPFSLNNLIIILSIIILILLLVSYILDEKIHFSLEQINLSNLINPKILFFCFLPLLSILGTYALNFYNINILILILLISISLTPFFFNKIEKKFFPIIILTVSVALLFHRSLISTQLWGSDIFEEYYFAKLIVDTTVWNFTIPTNLNSMLSIVSLAPIYSLICDLSIENVFKIIYPLIYSIVPLGLFLIFERNTNKEIAFLATLFFMFVVGFYGGLPALARQEIGELFFVLLILIFSDKYLNMKSKSFLFVFFSLSLIVSHYALSYFYLLFIILLYPSLKLMNKKETLNITALSFFLVFALTWYIYTASSSSFNSIVDIINLIVNNFSSDFLQPGATEGLATVLVGTTSFLYTLMKYEYIFAELLIFIGLSVIILRYISKKIGLLNNLIERFTISLKTVNMTAEYFCFSIYSFLILVATVLVPYFSGNLGTMRLFYIMLMFLAPFLVIGIIISLDFLRIITRRKFSRRKFSNYLKVVSFFLMVFLLLDSGVFHEILNDPNPNSISLSTDKNYQEASLFTQEEAQGAFYLKQISGNSKISTDIFGRQILRGYIYPKDKIQVFKEYTKSLNDDSFIFFRKLNVEGNIMLIPNEKRPIERPYLEEKITDVPFYNSLINKNKIYSDGDAEIYK